MKATKVDSQVTVSRKVVGSEMVVTKKRVTRYSLRVDFAEILAAATIEDDGDMDAPWKEQEGYEHRVVPVDDSRFYRADADTDAIRGNVYSDYHRQRVAILLDPSVEADAYELFRERGMSKQTAREQAALSRRRITDQIVKWYESGWNWYGAACDFRGYTSSCWGIDDYDYAYSEVRVEVAMEVADQMEEDGFIIENRPEPPKIVRGMTREHFVERLRRNVKLDCWTD